MKTAAGQILKSDIFANIVIIWANMNMWVFCQIQVSDLHPNTKQIVHS